MVSVVCDMKLIISTTQRMAMNTLLNENEIESLKPISSVRALRPRLVLHTSAPSTLPPHLPRHDGEEPTQTGRLGQVSGHPPVQIHALGPGTLCRHGSSALRRRVV